MPFVTWRPDLVELLVSSLTRETSLDGEPLLQVRMFNTKILSDSVQTASHLNGLAQSCVFARLAWMTMVMVTMMIVVLFAFDYYECGMLLSSRVLAASGGAN